VIKILSITLILFFSFLSASFSAKDIKDFEKIDLTKDQNLEDILKISLI
jgi:hypothetical protein